MREAELEERKLVSCAYPSENNLGNGKRETATTAPLLLSRSNLSMTFKPAPYALEEEVVTSSL